MRADLLALLRAHPAVIAAAGTIPLGTGVRPAIDWLTRRSDEPSAFPACTLQVIAGAGAYDHNGPDALELPRVRLMSFGTSYEQAEALRAALRTAIEPKTVHGNTRFGPAKLVLERDLPPEDLPGGLTIFRIAGDYVIPATPA